MTGELIPVDRNRKKKAFIFPTLSNPLRINVSVPPFGRKSVFQYLTSLPHDLRRLLPGSQLPVPVAQRRELQPRHPPRRIRRRVVVFTGFHRLSILPGCSDPRQVVIQEVPDCGEYIVVTFPVELDCLADALQLGEVGLHADHIGMIPAGGEGKALGAEGSGFFLVHGVTS